MSDATKQEIRELVEASAGIRRYAAGDYFGNRAYATAVERYERALLQPGVVATLYGEARPAVEDPRDATIAKLRDALLDVQWSQEIRGYGMACPWCDCGEKDGGHDPSCQLAEALRAAGVEPTSAQEGKASR